jgi:hypothetical protein
MTKLLTEKEMNEKYAKINSLTSKKVSKKDIEQKGNTKVAMSKRLLKDKLEQIFQKDAGVPIKIKKINFSYLIGNYTDAVAKANKAKIKLFKQLLLEREDVKQTEKKLNEEQKKVIKEFENLQLRVRSLHEEYEMASTEMFYFVKEECKDPKNLTRREKDTVKFLSDVKERMLEEITNLHRVLENLMTKFGEMEAQLLKT